MQRVIEASGFVTITLSNIPDLTASVSVPRLVGIEAPGGRTLGQPGASERQMAVLQATLQALDRFTAPGERYDLPFEWDESAFPKVENPYGLPPIANYLARHPWQVSNLLKRDVPEEYRV